MRAVSRILRRDRALLVLALVCATAIPLASYTFVVGRSVWPGAIVMNLQLGPTDGTLADGCRDWGECAEDGLAIWNDVLPSANNFRVVRDSTVPIGDGDEVNSVFWNDTVFGDPFGEDTLAITTHWRRGSSRVEADVVFNTAKSFNSYRGTLDDEVNDFRRVAIHEFGHVLGLSHPDEAGQSVRAIMNSVVSDIEFPQDDDINGARELYPGTPTPPAGGTPVQINFPPRNESVDFRNQLEAKYRDGLRRGQSQSAVDIEGTVVWTQEYLRYRVNACSHSVAVSRVFLQIEGRGIQPVCGTATTAQFPPRNEPFDFRTQLESKYRNELQRAPVGTYVDTEGDIVWTQEYLRYRVSRCGHAQAVERVMQQIDGRGILPTC